MKYYDQALILIQPPVTLDSLRAYDALLAKAKGIEAERIGELYTVLISNADPEAYEQYVMEMAGDE